MDYKKIYNSLIEKAKIRNCIEDEYYEKHHIIPRCLGGSDEKENLIKLTPEEHYVAHQLLVKIWPNENKLVFAAAMMIPNRPSNKMYGWLKRKHKVALQQLQSGDKNSQYGKRWIYSVELKISKRYLNQIFCQ